MFVFFVFVSYPAFAQINSGTIIIFNFAKNQLVVAADSRGVDFNTGKPEDLECKIARLNHKFIFASAGSVRFSSTLPNTVPSWDNTTLAREAVSNAAEKKREIDVEAVANEWADAVRDHWNSFCSLSPLSCARLTEARNGLLTSGMFFKARDNKVSMDAAEFFFDISALPAPIHYYMGSKMVDCWSCGEGPSEKICAAGSHIEVAAKFCSERKYHSKINIRTHLKGATNQARLAAKLIELTIDAYGVSSGDVGGPVDVATLRKDGSIRWNAIKKTCPEN